MAKQTRLLIDNSVLSFGMIGVPVHTRVGELANPLLLIEGVQPKNPWERREIESLPTIARLGCDGELELNIIPEIRLEAWKRPGSYPHFRQGDFFADAKFQSVPSAVERGKFFQGPANEQISKAAVIKFCEWLIAGYSHEWLKAPYLRMHLSEREVDNLRDIDRFRLLCEGVSKHHYPDVFHLWTAETHEIPIFLTADAKFIRVMCGKKNIDWRCRPVSPSQLLADLDIAERVPLPYAPGKRYYLLNGMPFD